MKRELAVFAAAALLGVSGCSQPGPGPGMMDGAYGPGYGMGSGMMGGGYAHGYGMGPGMRMGPRMMWGYGGMPSELSAEQRAKLAEIQQELRQKQWDVMQSMHSLMGSAQGAAPGGVFDEQAARKTYDAVAALHKQMFENSLEARKRMDALLTPQQREQLRLRRGAR